MIALCAFTIAQGWSVIDFAHSRAANDAGSARAWIGVPAFDATLRDITGQYGSTAVARRIDSLEQLLAARPMSSAAWLSLAETRLTGGQPYKDVLAALRMSSLTGPNEAAVMWPRGVFCLLQWDALPPDFQHRAILDLAGPITAGIVTDAGRRLIRGVVGAKTPQTRARVAALLQIEGVDPEELAGIGLGAIPAPAAGQ